jgi:hypothetical protein
VIEVVHRQYEEHRVEGALVCANRWAPPVVDLACILKRVGLATVVDVPESLLAISHFSPSQTALSHAQLQQLQKAAVLLVLQVIQHDVDVAATELERARRRILYPSQQEGSDELQYSGTIFAPVLCAWHRTSPFDYR